METDELRNQIDRLFEPVARNWTEGLKGTYNPIPMELIETPQCYKLRAQIPGVHQEHMDIQASEKGLTIKVDYPSQELATDEYPHLREIGWGKFSRALEFSDRIVGDKIKATYKDGVLTLEIPKEKAQPGTTVKVNVDTPTERPIE
jgi:HSP20 family protein